jgi:hypothetical protein
MSVTLATRVISTDHHRRRRLASVTGPLITETVYRHIIRPTIRGGATVMGSVFDDDENE